MKYFFLSALVSCVIFHTAGAMQTNFVKKTSSQQNPPMILSSFSSPQKTVMNLKIKKYILETPSIPTNDFQQQNSLRNRYTLTNALRHVVESLPTAYTPKEHIEAQSSIIIHAPDSSPAPSAQPCNPHALIDATRNEDDTEFNRLINSSDTTIQDDNGYTALMWAAYNGNAKKLFHLITCGIKMKNSYNFINYKNNQGETALSYAAYAGHAACLEVLLCHKANIATVNKSGTTPLMQACFNNQAETLDFLLKKNVSPATFDNLGKTASAYAQYAQADDCLYLLSRLCKKTTQ